MAKKKNRKKNRPNPTAPLNNQQLQNLANNILSPIQQHANNQAQAAQGFGTALANLYQPLAGTVQGAYDNAADKTAGYANGFSTGLQLLANQGDADANARLAQQGSPQQLNSGTGASDALYGAGGYIPASTLQREGAAFTAAAAMAPTYAGNQARQDATRLRMEAIQQIAQQRPQLMQALREFELQKYAAKINAGYLSNARMGTRLDKKAERHRHQEAKAGLALDAANLAQQAAAASGKDPGKLQDYWDNTRADVLDKAEQFANIDNPNPFKPPIKLPYNEAYHRLWRAYGAELRRRGFKKAAIKKMLDNALRANGIKPNGKKNKPIDIGWIQF